MKLHNQKTSSFSRALQEYRFQHNITQAALADLLQVSRRSVLFWESGKKFPSWDTIIRVARLTGLSCDFLMGLAGPLSTKIDALPNYTKSS